MIDGTNSALSALNGFSGKMAVISNNVANVNTDGFKKSKATLVEGQNGGVEVSVEKIDTSASPIPYEEDYHAQSEETSQIQAEEGSDSQARESSNVDLAEEMVDMISTQRGHEANLKSLNVQNEMQGTIIDMFV